jgi:small subunit ribosomal protein S16
VAVKIKLKRLGKIRAPYYRIVVADARTKRDGRAIEEIGKYHPKADPSVIEVDTERAQHWLSVGAQPTDPVRKILEITGDWQKFKGLPGSEGTLRTAEPRADRKAAFAAAVAENLADTEAKPKSRTTTRSTRTKKAEETKAEETKAEETKAEEAKKPAKAPAAEAPEAPAAEAPEAPAAEAPAAPAAEAPAAEETKAEEIQAEETKAEESKKPAKAAAAKAAAAEDSEAEAAPAAETAEQTEAAADGAGEADGSS